MSREMGDIVVRNEHPKWFVWRDLVTLLLALAVVMLILTVRTNAKTRQVQFTALSGQLTVQSAQIDSLRSQLGTAQQQSAGKDTTIAAQQRAEAAENSYIRTLTRQLVANGIRPAPEPQAAATPAAATPSPAPNHTRHSPGPTPSATPAPTPTPTPTPSATSTCLLPLFGTCVIP